jgi:hypothetical protein
MTPQQAVKVLDDHRWNGRRWQYDSHMIAAYYPDSNGDADEFDYAFDHDSDGIAIAEWLKVKNSK